MTILTILYTILLAPLELLFDSVFAYAYRISQNPVVSLIALSITINILVLPLYRRADAIKQEEMLQLQKLTPGIEHIKKAFKGDERFMILQAYYRQNNYKPYYALKGSLSLMLEIPFFITAYRYLSNLKLLQNASFGPISNLGAPDNLLTIGGYSIHILPILMTLINIVSGMIYSKNTPLKDKIQLYGMAGIFLVLLYESPSGLVFYWTLNNLFSLVKNIFYRLKNPQKILSITGSFVGILLFFMTMLGAIPVSGTRRKLIMVAFSLLLQFPLVQSRLPKISLQHKNVESNSITSSIFIGSIIFLTILVGGLIPSAIINASPSEFVEMSDFHSPLLYILQTILLSIGVFSVWFVIFYRLASPKGKKVFSFCSFTSIVFAVINYMFFGRKYGNLSSLLRYDVPLSITASQYIVNFLTLIVALVFVFFIWSKNKKLIQQLCYTGCIAIAIMTMINIGGIYSRSLELEDLASKQESNKEQPHFTLDKNGKNVVVIMLDRAINSFVPYMLEERPELKEQFSGFTYYPNAFSYGGTTNVGSPALFGGYEYTPYEIQKRNTVSLKDKQNEALRLMPAIFSDNGFKVTVCDPPYANYEFIPDLTIFDQYENVKAYRTFGAFDPDEEIRIANKDMTIKRNLFCYSIFKTMPVLLHKEVYDNGNYNSAKRLGNDDVFNEENVLGNYAAIDKYTSTGVKEDFLPAFRALQNMSTMTEIGDFGDNTYLTLCNDTTHNVMLLQEPEYEPHSNTDNKMYEMEHTVRKAKDAKDLQLETITQMEHYQCNMAAFIQLGKWFDYLKANDVWDNTRIIIASDHGRSIGLNHLIMDGVDEDSTEIEYKDAMFFNPLLMIKDFGNEEFTTDDSFMTLADIPSEAFKDLISNPTNPFTGNQINQDMKNSNEQYAMYTNWNIEENHGNTFADPIRITLKNHYMFNQANWEYGD